MSTTTQIEWADKTWSPVVGCTQVSPGCAYCYAMVMHNRRHKAYTEGKLQNVPQYAHPFSVVQLLEDRLDEPLRWRKPQRVFVNSQSDLFHDDVPDEYIARVWQVMAEAERHTFQILTKRPARMLRWFTEYLPEACSGESPAPVWPLPNVWLGVSVENQRFADERIPLLLQTPAAVRFLSCEPLLGPLDLRQWLGPAIRAARGRELDQTDITAMNRIGRAAAKETFDARFIDWVITGMESGKGARAGDHAWVRSLRDQCEAAGVKFMWKQDATPNGRKISLPVLDGRQWTEMPQREAAHT